MKLGLNTRNLLYIFSLTPAMLVIYGNLSGGVFTLINFFYSLVFLALVEWLTPPIEANEGSDKNSVLPQFILLMHIPFQLCALASLFYGIYTQAVSGLWILAASLSTGLNTGSSAIVVSHEFIHRKNAFELWLGKLLLFTAGNMYFYIEHLRVHHKWVGTEKDHATAKLNESLYGFFARSVKGQFTGALLMEADRLKKENKMPFSLENYVIRQIILQFLLLIVLFYFFGFAGVLGYLFQALVANFLLEYVNYIQHYGLSRNEKQRVTEHHSWDCNQFVSRFILVDLARHADHHFYASKPYHTLLTYEQSNKLPSGYAGLFFVAAIPPLWRKVIHPLLKYS
ncbi:MAG: alkane 1-monooxygenase [Bacteroidia bacterium]